MVPFGVGKASHMIVHKSTREGSVLPLYFYEHVGFGDRSLEVLQPLGDGHCKYGVTVRGLYNYAISKLPG